MSAACRRSTRRSSGWRAWASACWGPWSSARRPSPTGGRCRTRPRRRREVLWQNSCARLKNATYAGVEGPAAKARAPAEGPMRRTSCFPVLVGLAILLAGGVAHGVWTDRWRPNQELLDATGRVAALPASVGEWKSVPYQQEADALEMAGA